MCIPVKVIFETGCHPGFSFPHILFSSTTYAWSAADQQINQYQWLTPLTSALIFDHTILYVTACQSINKQIFQINNNLVLQYRLRQCWCATNTFKRVPPLQITITLTKSDLVIFLQSWVEKLLHGQPGIKPTTLDLNSQAGAYGLSATATQEKNQFWTVYG